MAVASLPHFEEEAKKRQSAGGGAVPAKLPEAVKGESRDQAAAAVGVSPRYVSDAKKIQTETPETFENDSPMGRVCAHGPYATLVSPQGQFGPILGNQNPVAGILAQSQFGTNLWSDSDR